MCFSSTSSCIVRAFCEGDKHMVKSLLRDAAFGNIWPGIKDSLSGPTLQLATMAAGCMVFVSTNSLVYCCLLVIAVLSVVCLSHTLAACYYVCGPPLADLDRIPDLYQSTKRTQFWVAEVKHNDQVEVIGTVAIVQKSEQLCSLSDVAYLRRMAVHKKYRRQGIAVKLLETAVVFCQHHGYDRIELITTDIHKAAMRLYRKFGFTCSVYKPRYYIFGLVPIWTYEFEYRLHN